MKLIFKNGLEIPVVFLSFFKEGEVIKINTGDKFVFNGIDFVEKVSNPDSLDTITTEN